MVVMALATATSAPAPVPTTINPPTFQPGETEAMNYKTPTRSGTINGVEYSYRIDPSGRSTFAEIGAWVIRVRSDEMTDRETWHIDHDETHLMVFPSATGKTATFRVMGHDFPGRQAMVRVDARPAVTSDTDDCFSSSVLWSALPTASKLRTRRYEWPYDIGRDEAGDATHFADAVKLYRYMKSARFN